jgi:cytoskeletal protein CcmA (bactofilin family)
MAADLQSGENLNIKDTHRNLYASGTTINIDAPTNGDLVAMGSEIAISKPIEDGLLASGGSVKLSGDVGQSARIAAGTTTVENRVGGDLFVGTGTFSSSDTMKVEGDLFLAGGTLNINGGVDGKTVIYASSVSLNGEFKGDVNIVADKITISDKTKIGGKLTYKSPSEATITPGATIAGGIDYTKSSPKTGIGSLKSSTNAVDLILSILGMIILALVLLKLFGNFTRNMVNSSVSSPLKNAWNGFAFLILMPLLSILLAFTIIGLSLGIFGMIIYGAVLIVSSAIATIFTGKLIMNLIGSEQRGIDILTCTLGALVFVIVGYIPVFGWFVKLVIMLIAVGATVSYLMTRIFPPKITTQKEEVKLAKIQPAQLKKITTKKLTKIKKPIEKKNVRKPKKS